MPICVNAVVNCCRTAKQLISAGANSGARIAIAVAPISEIYINEGEEQATDQVTLTTAHGAKGTESPVCYVIQAQPGMYPHSKACGKRDEEEEERRVLYVAMTRAKNELIVTRTNMVQGGVAFPGRVVGQSAAGAAYFLQGMPDGLVRRETVGFGIISELDASVVRPMDRGKQK